VEQQEIQKPEFMMLFENPKVQNVLRRMAIKMEEPPNSREDLMQEALIHLWREEQQRPGQQRVWYLRSVWNFLRNHMTRGRSVDSRKHRSKLIAFTTDCNVNDEWQNSLQWDEGIMSDVIFHDILSVLAKRLGKIDREILCGLAEGLQLREIAEGLQVTHVSVFKHRRKIASVAVDLGIEPPPRHVHAGP
jgi:DNA-directed RNA polymerase specialized sigma24 family protein